MPENDPFRKYIETGMVFTQLTRQRAEEIVRELIHNGEVNREQATRWVEELLERSRQSTELLLGVVRKELDDRISALNLVTRDDLANLAARITGVAGPRGASRARGAGAKAGGQTPTTGAKAPGTRATPAKTAGAKKSAGAATAAGSKGAAKKAPAAKKEATRKAASKKTAATTKAAGAKKSATAATAGAASRPSSRPRKA